MSEYIVNETVYPGATKQEIIGELVRCRDCKYSERHVLFSQEYMQCNRRFEQYWINIFVDQNDFCSYGERKDG